MASEEEKQEGKGFTVQDRRRFSPETGEAREEASPEQPQGSAQRVRAEQAESGAGAREASSKSRCRRSIFRLSSSV